MEQLKLRPYDGIAVTAFLILPSLFATTLSGLAEQNNTAAWISLLIAFLLMLCLFLIIFCLMKRYEGKNIVEITSAVTGRFFGALYAAALFAYFGFFTGVNIRESAEVLKIYGLSLTPIHVITGLLLLTAVIMNFLGGRPIVKTAGFFFVIIIAGIAFIMLLGLNRYNPDNLAPILGNGLPDIVYNGLFMASLFDGVIALFLFAPAFSGAAKLKKSGTVALMLFAAVYVLLTLCFIMMFSPSVGSKMTGGFIEMGKSIYYNHFFYRFEVILVLLLILAAAVQASIGILIARKSLACVVHSSSVRMMTIISAVPALIAVLLPVNLLDLTQRYLPLIRQYSVVFMAGFPLLVLIISSIKRLLKFEKYSRLT